MTGEILPCTEAEALAAARAIIDSEHPNSGSRRSDAADLFAATPEPTGGD
jgi:hypothetical protein